MRWKRTYPSGIIYDPKTHKISREINLQASKPVSLLFYFLRLAGSAMITYTLISIFYLIFPIAKEELLFYAGKKEIKITTSGFGQLINKIEAERISYIQKEAAGLGLDNAFSLYIPKIGAKAKIIANVSAADENEFNEALARGVAHARGTFFPGQGKTIFLFAHSTNSRSYVSRLNAVFYLLDKLNPGDKIIIFFANDRYEYAVREKLIVSPQDVSWLADLEDDRLILQTCFPPGTQLKRLLVIAKPI